MVYMKCVLQQQNFLLKFSFISGEDSGEAVVEPGAGEEEHQGL